MERDCCEVICGAPCESVFIAGAGYTITQSAKGFIVFTILITFNVRVFLVCFKC